MKIFGMAAGLFGLVAAGSANAAVLYDTITGQTHLAVGGSNLIQAPNAGFHAPLGADFTTATSETLTSVEVQLTVNTTVSGLQSDAGSVLVYLVPGTGSPSLPTG